jgi:hypothetical protein
MLLATFSDDQYGQIQKDNSVLHPYQGVLVWVMSWRNQPCHPIGPPPIMGTHPSPWAETICEFTVFVDANSNRTLMAIEGAPPT